MLLYPKEPVNINHKIPGDYYPEFLLAEHLGKKIKKVELSLPFHSNSCAEFEIRFSFVDLYVIILSVTHRTSGLKIFFAFKFDLRQEKGTDEAKNGKN